MDDFNYSYVVLKIVQLKEIHIGEYNPLFHNFLLFEGIKLDSMAPIIGAKIYKIK